MKWLLFASLCILILYLIAQHIGSLVMIEKARTELGQNWKGTVNIEKARFRLFSPSSIYNISLTDQQGRKWLEIPLIRFGFSVVKRQQPAITSLNIPSAEINLFSRPDSEDWPLEDIDGEKVKEENYFDLRDITTGKIQVLVHRQDDPDRPVLKKDFSFNLKRQEDDLAFIALLRSETYEKPFVIKVARPPGSGQLELIAGGKYDITRAESAFIISLFTDYDIFSASGVIDADLSAGHTVNEQVDVTKAAGTLKIENWTVFHRNTPMVTNINTILKADKSSIVSHSLTADIAGGILTGSFLVNLADYDNIKYEAALNGENFQLSDLFAIIGTPEKLSRGRAKFDLALRGTSSGYENLDGKGSVEISQADLQTLEVFKKIASAAGIQKLDPAKMSDVIIDFEIKGPEIVLNRARVANNMIAVDTQPGGTLNLKTDKLDIHVVVGVFKLGDDILRSIPLINIIAKAKDNLTQILVQGNLRDPDTGITVKKEPLKDIAETTLNFLGDVISLQGGIIKGITGGKKEPKTNESPKPILKLKPVEPNQPV